MRFSHSRKKKLDVQNSAKAPAFPLGRSLIAGVMHYNPKGKNRDCGHGPGFPRIEMKLHKGINCICIISEKI